MSRDSYMSEREYERQQKYCVQKIFAFAEARKTIKKFYQHCGFLYIASSENNYRDSWFHYRKLYQERSANEIEAQKAMLEEHLQRAEKDALVHFLQEISTRLEFWYRTEPQSDELRRNEMETIESVYRTLNFSTSDWMSKLKACATSDVGFFAKTCIYIAEKQFISDAFKCEAQELLHQLKNTILQMRMEGSEILRMDVPGKYLEQCGNVMKATLDFLEKHQMLPFIGITDKIKDIVKEST